MTEARAWVQGVGRFKWRQPIDHAQLIWYTMRTYAKEIILGAPYGKEQCLPQGEQGNPMNEEKVQHAIHRVALRNAVAHMGEGIFTMKTAKFLIDVGFQRDGYTFRPDPRSRVWLEKTYPDRPRVASVFIGFDQHQDLQQIPQSIWHQVVQLLTGLSFVEINNIGGFVVTNPQTEQEVFNSLMVYA